MTATPTPQPRRTDRADADLLGQLADLRRPIAGDIPLSQIINPMVVEGELYEPLPDSAVHCFACGHNCTIKPGGRGICQVRYNLGGKLYAPWGYVAALQCDPIEKKPFNHVHPGSDTLTFGMLGCDLHCSYCFTGDTMVITNRGPIPFSEAFALADRIEHRRDGDIGYVDELRAVAHSGQWRKVRAVFKHRYHGKMAVIRAVYLPEFRCTPDHRVYATDSPESAPELIQARCLTEKHYLAVPRHFSFSHQQTIDVRHVLENHHVTYKTPWKLSPKSRALIVDATARGETFRQIGATLGVSGSYVRHVRSKIARGLDGDQRTEGLILERDTVRFPNEHRPGIPSKLPLDEGLARLLGYYCAEGSVTKSKSRPNSLTLNFSFSKSEVILANDVARLLRTYFGLKPRLVQRETTLGVAAAKASVGLLFKSLAGDRSDQKRVPSMIFDAHRCEAEVFVNAVVEGDGHRYPNGKISFTTVSRDLAYGIAWLILKLGYLPSIYPTAMGGSSKIQGRIVNRAPYQYTIVWYEHTSIRRKMVVTDDFYLVPLREISFVDYEGDVYNMEVEDEHNYLANFFLVSNCQNWDISQALRDSEAGHPPSQVTPQEMVALAKRNGGASITSSYNEPLITSEWAVAIFKEAKAAGLPCNYVSNGNATREVLEYIRPYVGAYKIDLKTMNDKSYRTLGAVLNHVLDGVRMVHELGFWLEVVTLVIPGFNDAEDELRDAARFLKSLSPDIPWHVTAFHRDYHMQDPDNTGARALMRAAEIGMIEGLNYVYAGNLPGQVGQFEHTFCPNCHSPLIKRFGYVVLDYQITSQGTCPRCQTGIPGVWPRSKDEVHLGTPNDLYFRAPRAVR